MNPSSTAVAPDESARATTSNACIACGSRVAKPLFAVGSYHYVACAVCGLAHLDPLPDAATLASCFDDAYFTGGHAGGYDDYARDAPVHRRNAQRRLGRIERFVPRPGRLLDVGCAYGYMVDTARDHGWDAEGVEISAALVEHLRDRGVTVAERLADVAANQPGSFDVVTAYAVLEHVADPAAFLRDAVRCLRPRGVLVLEAWDRSRLAARVAGRHWHIVTPPSVAWLYAREPLALLLQRAGASDVVCRSERKWVSVGFVASLLDGPEQPRVVAAAGRSLRRLPARWRVPYPVSDLMAVVARRTEFVSLPEEEQMA